MGTTIRVMATVDAVLQHAFELATRRRGEDGRYQRQARGLDELGYAVVPKSEAYAPGAPGTLLDAVGNAVYEAGLGRSGPDPTWQGVAEAATRAAAAWHERRPVAPAVDAIERLLRRMRAVTMPHTEDDVVGVLLDDGLRTPIRQFALDLADAATPSAAPASGDRAALLADELTAAYEAGAGGTPYDSTAQARRLAAAPASEAATEGGELPEPLGDLASWFRAAAAGRREYAEKAPQDQADVLHLEASVLDGAARLASGDTAPMYGWLPSWREGEVWSAEPPAKEIDRNRHGLPVYSGDDWTVEADPKGDVHVFVADDSHPGAGSEYVFEPDVVAAIATAGRVRFAATPREQGTAEAATEGGCQTCTAHRPNLHPAVQEGGEVQLCPDPFHSTVTPENTAERVATLAQDLSRYYPGRVGWWTAGRDVAAMLAEFHTALGQTYGDGGTSAKGRADMQQAETDELRDELLAGDQVGIARELADIVYLAYGTAFSYGIDLDAVVAEVHAANMRKRGPDGAFTVRDDGKVMKPDGWTPPDVAAALDRAYAREQGTAEAATPEPDSVEAIWHPDSQCVPCGPGCAGHWVVPEVAATPWAEGEAEACGECGADHCVSAEECSRTCCPRCAPLAPEVVSGAEAAAWGAADERCDDDFEHVAFAGGSDPENAALVRSFGLDRAAAEEHARWFVEGGVARRREPEQTAWPWELIDGWQDPDGESRVVSAPTGGER